VEKGKGENQDEPGRMRNHPKRSVQRIKTVIGKTREISYSPMRERPLQWWGVNYTEETDATDKGGTPIVKRGETQRPVSGSEERKSVKPANACCQVWLKGIEGWIRKGGLRRDVWRVGKGGGVFEIHRNKVFQKETEGEYFGTKLCWRSEVGRAIHPIGEKQ